jgi:outer membrane protein TolC
VAELKALPEPRRNVPAGLPVALLSRRPDVLAAELRLFESLNLESAARKALLPGIRLTGDKGYSSQELADLVSVQAAVWTIASGVTQPLFQGGRLRAGAKRARARYDELLNVYAGTAQTAFREVETALAAERFLVEQQEELARAKVEAERAEQLALGQYGRGLVDVLTVLDSRQRAYDANRALVTARALRLRNRADLYLALGGAFD